MNIGAVALSGRAARFSWPRRPTLCTICDRVRRPHDHEQVDGGLHRFFELSMADQLEAYRRLRDYLGEAAITEIEGDRQLRRRAEALEAVGRVAEHLGLEEGRAPTVGEFDAP